MIIEPKQVNSGTPQGAFLKRQMALNGGSNRPFQPEDFSVGLDIGIYGRQFRIYDADQFTRDFYVVSINCTLSTDQPPKISAKAG